jgi:cell division protein FtsB
MIAGGTMRRGLIHGLYTTSDEHEPSTVNASQGGKGAMRQGAARNVVISMMVAVGFFLAGCGQEVKKENEQLKAQVASLQKENADLKTEIMTLKGENGAMKKELEEMKLHMEQMKAKPGKAPKKK